MPEGREALTRDKKSKLIDDKPFVFLCCCIRMGTSFVVVSHAHSTCHMLATVQPNL
jgi:hypothetical protein